MRFDKIEEVRSPLERTKEDKSLVGITIDKSREDFLKKNVKSSNVGKFSLLLLLGLFLIGFTSAITIQQIFPPPQNWITPNNTQYFSFDITTDYLQNITDSYNNINTTIFDNFSWVAGWNFNNLSALGENDSIFYDISGNGNNGNCSTAKCPAFNSSDGNNGDMIFNGKNESIRIMSFYNYPKLDTWTISMTTQVLGNSTDLYGAPYIFSNLTGRFQMNGADGVTLGYYCTFNNATLAVSGICTGNMRIKRNIVVTYDNITLRLYQDGALYYSKSIIGPLNLTSSATNFIGTSSASYGRYNGSIDDLMIFNRTLSASEVLYLNNSNLQRNNLTSYQLNTTKSLSNYSQSLFLCSSNLTSQTCSAINTIQKLNTITANFSNSIGIINPSFYGANVQNFAYGYGYPSHLQIDKTCDGTVDTITNMAWHEQEWNNVGLSNLRDYIRFRSQYSNSTNGFANFTGNLTKQIEEVKWAHDNGKRVLITIYDMPSFLANTSKPCISDQNQTCPPNDYTIWGNILLDAINRVTSNGLYNSSVDIEVWNEPYLSNYTTGWGGEWISQRTYDHIDKANEYVYFYNKTYDIIKSVYPSMGVGGPVAYNNASTPNIVKMFFSNMSNKTDFFVFHPYVGGLNTNTILTQINAIISECNLYNANCSRLILSEWNYEEDNLKWSNVSIRKAEYEVSIAKSYSEMLLYPSNISSLFFEWGSWNAFGCPSYSGGTDLWDMVSEAGLANPTPTYYVPFNVTQAISHLCPSGATVSVSSNDDNTIKRVSCSKGSSYSIIIINTDTNAKNSTLNLSLGNGSVFYPYKTLKNYNGYETYNVNSGVAQLGILDSYGIMYLTSGITNQTALYDLNENSGNVLYDKLGITRNGVKSGADWSNDGVLITLGSGNYTLNTANGLFNLTNSAYNYDWIITNYLYNGGKIGRDIINLLSNSAASPIGYLPIIVLTIILGIVMAIIWKSLSQIKLEKNVKF